MSENLVIVESPAKGKTIQKYLGNGFEVLASYGHVRDLIPKEGAVDPENGYAMRYEIIDRNQKHVDAIARALKKADNLYLATDPDREGEAISWHLYELLNERGALKGKTVQRVVFHEITKRAVQEAIENPRDLALDLVDAQQARRALDYLVGFNLSPLLWRKIKPSLSAGRVQSPALRLIVEREDEIDRFVRQEYWTMTAQNEKDAQPFTARLHTLDGQKLDQFDVNNEARATEVRERLLTAANGKLLVSKVDKKQRKRYPAPPFTTSTLQQEAVRKLRFSTQRAMRVAQQLYEGIDLGSDSGGTVGLITYMRTDSVSLANEAIGELRELIGQRYGQDKVPETANFYKTKSKNAQEAHEAVRPTSAFRTPEQVKGHLNEEQFKLYELIWKRTVACQMMYATLDTVSADLSAEAGSFFRASGSTIRDPGFLMVYEEGQDDRASEKESTLPPLVEGDSVTLQDIAAEQHFTEPPPRYSEASLVKTLEEFGIGRPSTYASIISTLLAREYVELESRRFTPTDIGRIVIRFLTEHFTQYVDYDFTANLENELDEISRGEKEWVPVMDAFWQPFHKLVDDKMESVNRSDVLQSREIGIDPVSGRPVSVRLGRFGPMVQIGTKDDEEKPVFSGLRPGMKLDTVTLEEALELFKLPRQLGETDDGKAISTNVGRFGAYVKFGDQFASLKKEDDPHTITLERALELIAEKKIKDAEKILVDFGNGIQILKGRWGPYINKVVKRVKLQARLPKDREPDSMTLEECEALIAVVAEAKSAKKGAKKAAASKTKPDDAAATAGDTEGDKPKAAKAAKPKAAPKKSATTKKPVAKKAAAKKPAAPKTTAPKKSAS